MARLIDKTNATCTERLNGAVPASEILSERLNESVPASAIIKTLAKQKRELEIENYELRSRLAILEDDIAAFKAHRNETIASHKEINKCSGSLLQVYNRIGKSAGAIAELAEATNKLFTMLTTILKPQELWNTPDTHSIE